MPYDDRHRAADGQRPEISERPELLILGGALGIAFPILFTLGILVLQVAVPNHDPVTNTISDLGRGPHAVWMDTLFYMNAAGHIALALGAAHAHLGRWGWSAGTVILTLIALDLVMLGIWDEFSSGSDPGDFSIHTRFAVALFPLYLAGPLFMARGAAGAARSYGRLFVAGALLWPLTSLAYFFGPEAIDGITERIAGASTLLWTVPLGWLLLKRGLRARS